MGEERPWQGGSRSLCLDFGVTTLWAPGLPGHLSVPPWVHFGKESLCPLAQPGVPPGTPEQGRRLEPGMHRQGHSATQWLRVTCEGTAGAACRGVAAKVLRPGSCSRGIPAQRGEQKAENRSTLLLCGYTRGKALGLSGCVWSEGFARLAQLLTEAKCWASWDWSSSCFRRDLAAK